MLDEQSGERKPGWFSAKTKRGLGYGGHETSNDTGPAKCLNDSGGASRFFYIAKPSTKERSAGLPEGSRNTHTTVKSIALMQHLISLIAAPSATVLDPFTGSGSTGVAALKQGCNFIGIEREPEYVEIARQRAKAVSG
jgi:DNA modification methylase